MICSNTCRNARASCTCRLYHTADHVIMNDNKRVVYPVARHRNIEDMKGQCFRFCSPSDFFRAVNSGLPLAAGVLLLLLFVSLLLPPKLTALSTSSPNRRSSRKLSPLLRQSSELAISTPSSNKVTNRPSRFRLSLVSRWVLCWQQAPLRSAHLSLPS